MSAARWWKKQWYFMLLLALFQFQWTGCFPQAYVSVKNDCAGAWFRISTLEGSGRGKAHGRLNHGERVVIELTGVANQGNKFVIMADGYRTRDDESIGTATFDLMVWDNPYELEGPNNNYNWGVSELYPGGKCPEVGF